MLKREDENGLKARLTWHDANEACKELLHVIEHGDRSVFRRRWVTAITLLRSVGYVLRGADRELHPHLEQIIDAKWQEPKPPIFTYFIERARNLTVKQYRSGLFGRWEVSSPMSLEPIEPEEEIEDELVFMEEGFRGEPFEKLLRESLEWWNQYLYDIESHLEHVDG